MSISGIREYLGTKMVYKNLPFVCFLAILGVIYIANAHRAEKSMRQIQTLKKELKQAKWKYMSVHSEVMSRGSASEIQDAVRAMGLLLPEQPVEVISSQKDGSDG